MELKADEETLEVRLGKALSRRNLWLVVAESCTGGLLSDRITDVSGSSAYFLGGVVAYANSVKHDVLGVKTETLERFGAVSQQTVLEMAAGVCHVMAGPADQERVIGLSISGIAGPTGGTPEKPVGLVWFAVRTPESEWAWQERFQGDRTSIKRQAADYALLALLDYLDEEVRDAS